MKILSHGDVFFFRCPSCGCGFQEAASRTQIASAGIGNPNGPQRVRHECPECGNDVIGDRRQWNDQKGRK